MDSLMKLLIKSAVKNFIIFSTALYTSISLAQNKLAIVIDDVGYHLKEDAAIFAMPREISVAIIPTAPHARARNQEAKSQGRDILIHMPMQPMSAVKIEDGGLHLGMSATQVNNRVDTAKNIVNYAIGMNNHMGSAATANPQLMTYLMTALQEKHLFFLDSRTIGKSVAGKIAKEQGVRSLDRHIFLDDSNELADVQHQFQAAIQYARKHGTAIAIGHPRANTIAVLQAGLNNLPADIQLVGMGNLWRNEKVIPPKPFILLFSEMPAPTSMEPFDPVGLLRGIPK